MAKEIGASSCKRSTRRILKIFFLNFWIITLRSQANGKVTDICYGSPKEDRRLESNATTSLTQVHVNFAIECILECAQDKTRSCRSVNYKIYSNSEEELNCELLKVEEQEENLKKNESYEYYIVQNNRKAADNFQSSPKPSATQKTLETVVENSSRSCNEILEKNGSSPSGIYSLRTTSGSSYRVYCHMAEISECGKGGWTLVLKVDGEKDTFSYNSAYWTNKETFREEDGFEGMTKKETKLASYWNTKFTKICVGMEKSDSAGVKWIVIKHEANSLIEVIADEEFTRINAGRNNWASLISDSKLQPHCDKEGFNIRRETRTYVRFGIVANNEDDCLTCNSCIGFGASITGCNKFVKQISCGNIYSCGPWIKHQHIPVFGYILVQ